MEEWKLEIRKVDNGYVLQGRFGDTDLISEQIIQIDLADAIYANNINFGSIDLKALQSLLLEVADYFEPNYRSKHNKNKIEIRILDENDKEIE